MKLIPNGVSLQLPTLLLLLLTIATSNAFTPLHDILSVPSINHHRRAVSAQYLEQQHQRKNGSSMMHSSDEYTFNRWRLLASSDKNGGKGDKDINSTTQTKKASFQALALTSLALVVLVSDRYLPVPSVPVAEFLILAAVGILFLGGRDQ
mmetsp:Transcript_2033/g.5360  ORF Transcript_2033/g.5360 Transcript_2033/m.5360 type:complete len:150 (-) Transcript_2033:292-741(-)